MTDLAPDLQEQLTAARASCTRWLGYRPLRPRDIL
ncbi:MAG: hypothetical protein QOH80_2133, partial [Actinomycetota bacterium]|nr:hypothetical protein [Actinomycetota bacterium]